MAAAALVISLLSLVVAACSAVFSAVYGHRQAASASVLAQFDAERRHAERRPSFEVRVEDVEGATWHRLQVRLTSNEAVDSVVIDLLEPGGVELCKDTLGVDAEAPSPVHDAELRDEAGHPGLGPGHAGAVRVQFPAPRPAKLRLNITARSADATWTVTVSPDVPPDLSGAVF